MEPGDNRIGELHAALRAWLVTSIGLLAVAGVLLLASRPATYETGLSLGEVWSDLSEAGAL